MKSLMGKIPPKDPTGIEGLDEVLFGGLPRGRTTLIRGGPGTGKTILAMEFIYRGALAGQPGIFVTFEERADILRQNALALGWDLAAMEKEGKLLLLQPDLPRYVVESGQFDIGGTLAILSGHVQRMGATRIVIDAADVILRMFRDPWDRENQLFLIHDWLAGQTMTSLLTLKISAEQPTIYDRLEYIADCAFHLDNRVRGQVTTRRLRVLKYRGSDFLSNEFPCVITSRGFALMPISLAELKSVGHGKISSGLAKLDTLLDGGFKRGSCVLVGGPSGSGKTIFACEFSIAACARNEKVLYLSFEESREGLVSGMKSPGLDLESTLKTERLKLTAIMPEAMGVEEHLYRIFQMIDEFKPEHLVVDSISACSRMGSEGMEFEFLMRLLTHCRSQGITCYYLNQTVPHQIPHSISGVGLSSLVDTLIVLDQDWPDATHRRRLLIIKSRGSKHSHLFHSFQITDQGVVIDSSTGNPLPAAEEDS